MFSRMFVITGLAAVACFGQPDRETVLLERITTLEARLAVLERRLEVVSAPPPAATASVPVADKPSPAPGQESALKDFTANVYFDGYYAWNTNRPLERLNLLRAYDLAANNLSINQTGIVLERAPGEARPWGYRMDLMFGQATETLQGNPQNELRPRVFRNLFQAYGTYLAPVHKGLTVDFGKWASALGPEGNYTKDQINYSRSYFFNFLPFYHMGVRVALPLNDRLSVSYWLVNGANQTEDFNGFRSQLGQAVIKPSKNLTWTLNYYNGREQRGAPAPRGRLHVIDTYLFWNPTSRLTLGGEFDYVVNRVEASGPAQVVTGGAGYFRYQLTSNAYFGQRYTRLNDHAGLFSGVTQRLNDLTSTIGYRPADGFEARLEYRRDFSNVPFFLRRGPVELSRHQDTLTVGLLWWFGGKSGGW